MSTCKSGADHIQSLKDGRSIYIDGELVRDVTTHPAFAKSVASAAALYDYQARPENIEAMTFEVPGSNGRRANRAWQMPTNLAETVTRRKALQRWARQSYGFMGRSPDHLASALIGQKMGLELFEKHSPARAKAFSDYVDYATKNDLFLTYVIINPQAERGKDWGGQAEDLVARIVDEDSEGITIRGAKMLATSGIMANEILVTCIQPLQPGDEKFALSFAIPMNTKGLKVLSRKSYEAAAENRFDSPISSRFDENDALIYFDDVKVPWDRVFVDRSIEMCQKQFHATPAHVYQNYQAQIRLGVKLRFLAGLARKIADINGIVNFPQVRETLGQFAAEVGMVTGLVAAMEAKGSMMGRYFVPDRHTLYTSQVLTQQLYGKLMLTLRELAGGGMIMLPSSLRDFANPELADLIDKTQQSPAADARDKVKFYRMAWDVVGSEFASRHTQYEMFYAGAQFVTKGHSFRTFDWAGATGMVDRMLGQYNLDGELARSFGKAAE